MERGKQVASSTTERWKMKEKRDKVVKNIADEFIKNVSPNLKFNLPWLIQRAEKFEERMHASAKTEDEYLSSVEEKLKSIRARGARFRKDAEAKNLLISPSVSAGTNANIDWQKNVYNRLQILKRNYNFILRSYYKYVCKNLQTDRSTERLNNLRLHKSEMENIFSLFELSKSQITIDMKDRPNEIHVYIQRIVNVFKQRSPDVLSIRQFIAMPINSSPCSINQPSISKGPDDAVQQQTNIALDGFDESINSPKISATEAFGAGTDSNTQRISPLIKESNNQNQVSEMPTLDSEEQSPAIERLIKVLTSISPEELRAAVDDFEEVVHLFDQVVDELGLPTFPEGYKMPRSFVATAFNTSSICGSMLDGFNQFTETAESNLDSFTMKGKSPKTVENQNLLAEIKEINNRLFDCEVVIVEKENVETAVGLAAEQSEGLLVKIMYNAVTINRNLVSKLTSDKKTLIKPLRLLIPASYPSSSLVILDELPLKVSDDLRALFERAKAKLKLNLQSINVPWLIKDIARAWEHCAREAILEYADANGGGTFTSTYGGWEAC
ncbi:hypothetical protein P8452_69589 [Trifolium repens]|nr:mediator of RNA polymerase II transcription subunit 15a [Trifolium repens]WJX87387.1 hypothetical protein P8452_69589 [Trifolium repens]